MRLTACELARRGHSLALAYRSGTGRNEAEWGRIFTEVFQLPKRAGDEPLEAALEHWGPDLIYLHSLEDLNLIEMLLRWPAPIVRMVHDHSLYCMRGYKYNYFTRKICTRRASAFCVFPCLAVLGRNPAGPLPIRWNSYAQKRREIELNRQCDGVVVYSDYSKTELIGNGFDPSRIHTCVPLSVWDDETLVSAFDPENLILFAGQIIRGKGVDVLLQALSRVKSSFRCVILGNGNHRARCETLCRRLDLGERVHFHGYLPPAELRSFYMRASVCVMSSLWPEPFGLAGPEAMRYGLPVVAFDAGGIREWLQDGYNGYLVRWGDTVSFASRLDELLQDKERARQMGRQARSWVRRYDCGRQIDGLEQLFLRLARQPRLASSISPQPEEILSAYD